MRNYIESIANKLFPQLNLLVSKTYSLHIDAELLKIQKRSLFKLPQKEIDDLISSVENFQLINQFDNSFQITTSNEPYDYRLTITFSREASLAIIKTYDVTFNNEEATHRTRDNSSSLSKARTSSFFSQSLSASSSIKSECIEKSTPKLPCITPNSLVIPLESGHLASPDTTTTPPIEVLARASEKSSVCEQNSEPGITATTVEVNRDNLKPVNDFKQEALSAFDSFLTKIIPIRGDYSETESSSFFQENAFLQELVEQQKFRQEAQNISKYLVTMQRQRFEDLFSKDSWHQSSQLMIMILLLDAGRANSRSVYPFRISLWGSPFTDIYHREATENPNFFNLVNFALINLQKEDNYLVPFASNQINLVRLLLSRGDYIKSQDEITTWELSCEGSDYKEQTHVVKIKKPVLKQALNTLGRLGALRPRDWQLLYLAFDNGNNIHNFYKHLLTMSSFYRVQLNSTRLQSIEVSFIEKKERILTQLGNLKANYRVEVSEEQRAFYCQIIIKLLKPIITPENLPQDNYLQALSTLDRVDDLILKLNNSSYLVFLRLTETIIDEILILLALQSQQKPFSAAEHLNHVSKFIQNTVGKVPDGVSLNASCMQGIWIGFELGLNFFKDDQKRNSINLLISKSCYYEVVLIMKSLFDGIDLENDCQDASLSLTYPALSTTALKSTDDTIYHLYIGNFEANFKLGHNRMLYTDINAFIAKQMELREKQQINTPLIVIIDNTMSEFDGQHLPRLLSQFKQEIENGSLAVFVCHSGNKYLHLGTDKVPASLMYAYFNNSCFPHLSCYFEQQLKRNKISDFNPHSPSLLLTSALLEYTQEEILVYSKGIRQRTLSIYNDAIPESLKDSEKQSCYFTVDNPTYEPTNNNCGFLIIRTSTTPVLEPHIYNDVTSFISTLINEIGIYNRDGFAFSQSTQSRISSADSNCTRISIGTENLDDLIKKIKLLCGALLALNAVIASYQKACSEHSNLLRQDALFDEMKRELIQFLARPNTASLTSSGESSRFMFFGEEANKKIQREFSTQVATTVTPGKY